MKNNFKELIGKEARIVYRKDALSKIVNVRESGDMILIYLENGIMGNIEIFVDKDRKYLKK